jgi:hypothetical protein
MFYFVNRFFKVVQNKVRVNHNLPKRTEYGGNKIPKELLK